MTKVDLEKKDISKLIAALEKMGYPNAKLRRDPKNSEIVTIHEPLDRRERNSLENQQFKLIRDEAA